MATRASSKKDSSQKPAAKTDPPTSKTAAPASATDLISRTRKKSATDTRAKTAVPPISKAHQAPAPSVSSPAAVTEAVAPAVPPAKPETISLIDDNKSKRSESSGSEAKQRS